MLRLFSQHVVNETKTDNNHHLLCLLLHRYLHYCCQRKQCVKHQETLACNDIIVFYILSSAEVIQSIKRRLKGALYIIICSQTDAPVLNCTVRQDCGLMGEGWAKAKLDDQWAKTEWLEWTSLVLLQLSQQGCMTLPQSVNQTNQHKRNIVVFVLLWTGPELSSAAQLLKVGHRVWSCRAYVSSSGYHYHSSGIHCLTCVLTPDIHTKQQNMCRTHWL